MNFPAFFDWLVDQSRRDDEIGVTARCVIKDKLFPRRARHLYLFLLRYDGLPRMRDGIKKAHAEYRRARRTQLEQVA